MSVVLNARALLSAPHAKGCLFMLRRPSTYVLYLGVLTHGNQPVFDRHLVSEGAQMPCIMTAMIMVTIASSSSCEAT